MKNTILNFGVIFLITIALTSCVDNKGKQSVNINTPEEVKKAEKETADIADQDFIDGMTGKIWHNYLEIKIALTNADAGQVQDMAQSMVASFSEERAEMKAMAQELSETEDLDKQRELFAAFTDKVGPMFEDALSGGTIYKKFCPMAFNNKGAYWYADIEEINNPYFGDEMPNCGSVKKTIKK
ncbi:DUF3347 domain-containing protein [Salegentibacter salegens]|uniref:DUF3347 domain-containing protein n=1 Tax=Salegentibacter salegens TaxID=143223 RepID=A0A1M7N9K9_9FLAO|nr:DUF3347 domain-containing protein [Salegentibacter salegens]PRX45687.1 uncharacterized protein DUF3347 [Salegentibacter salegens]SHM99764.1 Protein of unknown function [Salegentibacter salegens]